MGAATWQWEKDAYQCYVPEKPEEQENHKNQNNNNMLQSPGSTSLSILLPLPNTRPHPSASSFSLSQLTPQLTTANLNQPPPTIFHHRRSHHNPPYTSDLPAISLQTLNVQVRALARGARGAVGREGGLFRLPPWRMTAWTPALGSGAQNPLKMHPKYTLQFTQLLHPRLHPKYN